MRKILGLGAVVLVAGLAPAAANATTFSGKCGDIAGTATFAKPLTSQNGANHYDFAGTAHCDGTVDGKALPAQSPVHIHVAGDGDLGCMQGSGKGGVGTITLDATKQVVGFLMDFTSTASEVDIKLRGAKGGNGTGSATFRNMTDPAANLNTVAGCGNGGNKALSFTATATVPDSTPLDDGQTQAAPAPQQQSSGAQPQSEPQSGSGGGGGSQDNGSTSGSSQNQSSTPAQQSQPAAQNQPAKQSTPKKKKSKKHPKKSKKKKSKKGKKKHRSSKRH